MNRALAIGQSLTLADRAALRTHSLNLQQQRAQFTAMTKHRMASRRAELAGFLKTGRLA